MTAFEPVHIVLPHYNGKYDIIRAFNSIVERTCHPFILTIIDDGSRKDDEGYMFLRHLQSIDFEIQDYFKGLNLIFNDKNVGVTKNLNNAFFNYYKTLDCIRLDADIEIQSKYWLNELIAFANKKKNAGVIAPVGLQPDHMTISSAGQFLVIDKDDFDTKVFHDFGTEIFDKMNEPRFNLPDKPFEVDAVLGCCAYYRRDVIDKLKGVDEKYFGWVEDNDFCIGARNLGYKVYVLPNVSYCHWGHAEKRPNEEKMAILRNSEDRFIEKWGFSLFSPLAYFDDIMEKYYGNEIFWRYNSKYKNKRRN